MNEDTVTINVKDRKNKNQTKKVTLKGVEFIRRFLMHVLPKGFVKIRHYGLLANRNKKTKLELSRELKGSPTYKANFEGLGTEEILSIVIGRDINLCLSWGKGHLKPTYSLFIGASP
ncbi:MAG: family transposase [Firmicutes bacterium]|nr:family transposase [Bacillota bacterium]